MPNIKLRLPKITGKNEEEQIAQIKSYLVQLVNELQYVIDELSKESDNGGKK